MVSNLKNQEFDEVENLLTPMVHYFIETASNELIHNYLDIARQVPNIADQLIKKNQ